MASVLGRIKTFPWFPVHNSTCFGFGTIMALMILGIFHHPTGVPLIELVFLSIFTILLILWGESISVNVLALFLDVSLLQIGNFGFNFQYLLFLWGLYFPVFPILQFLLVLLV